MASQGADPAGVLAYNNDDTQAYLEAKGVTTLMCAVLKDVVTTKPDDPISCVDVFSLTNAGWKVVPGLASPCREQRRVGAAGPSCFATVLRLGWHSRRWLGGALEQTPAERAQSALLGDVARQLRLVDLALTARCVRVFRFMIDLCKNMTEDDYLPVAESDGFGSSLGGGSGGEEPDLAGEEIQEMILDMFLRADDDGNGYLDRGEFKRVL